MDARIRISLLSFLNNIKGLWDANWRTANDQDQVQRSVPRFILWNKNRRAMDRADPDYLQSSLRIIS